MQIREFAIRVAIKATNKFARENYGVSASSTRGAELNRLIDEGGFTDCKSAVRKLVSFITGETLPENSTEFKSVKFAVVVPIANTVLHNYTLNVPCMLKGPGGTSLTAIRQDGTRGNNLSSLKSEIRVATESEIRSLVTGWTDETVSKLFGILHEAVEGI